MKKTLLVCLIVVLVVIASAFGIGYGVGHLIKNAGNISISNGSNFNYSDAKSYKAGDAEISSKVSKLTINWLSGNVKVSEYSGDTLIIKDEVESGVLSDELKLRWKKSADEVVIQYAEAGKKLNLDGFKKNLLVMIPASWILDELEIDVVSANSVVSLKNIEKIDWNSVNGTLEVRIDSIHSLDGETVNGDVDLYVSKYGPRELDLESVNSNVIISVPSNTSFTLKHDSVNGSLDSEFAGKVSGNKTFIVGSGDYDWDIESVNGDIIIRER